MKKLTSVLVCGLILTIAGSAAAANDPKGTLSKDEQSKSMPMAGQANNHSSPSLDPPKK